MIPMAGGCFAVVDSDMAGVVSTFVWSPARRTNTGYATSQKAGSYLHRFLWRRWGGVATPHIDHIDLDGLNCRRSNLRAATVSQNASNKIRQNSLSRKRSPFKGVSLKKNRWSAQVTANKVVYSLGYFATQEEAAEAYRRGALKYHGEFARTEVGRLSEVPK